MSHILVKIFFPFQMGVGVKEEGADVPVSIQKGYLVDIIIINSILPRTYNIFKPCLNGAAVLFVIKRSFLVLHLYI